MDRRIFFWFGPNDTIFIICVYVDDYWTFCECDTEWHTFYTLWSDRFEPSESVVQAADDFCGVTYTLEPDGCLSA